MSIQIDNECALYRSLTLSERVQMQPPWGRERPREGSQGECPRLHRWRTTFAERSMFLHRLHTVGIDEITLREILAERPEDLRDRLGETPRWIAGVCAALDVVPGRAAETDANAEPAEDRSPFVRAFAPLLTRGRAELRSELTKVLARHPSFAYDPATITALEAALLPRVHGMAARALVLELNIARLQGTLAGTTPEERFADFLLRLEQPEMRATLARDYPVLFRQVALRIGQWIATSIEFIDRLSGDAAILRETLFGGRDPGPLVGIDIGAGDSHGAGRTVTIARFAAGAAVVYKPRPLAADRHFYELLKWLNSCGWQPAFQHIGVVDRGPYGWEEFVTRSACQSTEQVERFYVRCGGYLAVLYALAATDFHFENVIAAGEHPVLVDLEALFHPQLFRPPEAVGIAAHAISTSVIGVGLLPCRLWPSRDSAGLDVSGLGAEPDQLTPYDVLIPGRMGTDRMAFEPVRMPIGGRDHRPSLGGVDIEAAAYADSIARGFARMYRLLCDRRAELLAPNGPVNAFADDEVRVIIRPTQTYASLLDASFHPDLLHDALDREIFFDKLWSIPHHTAEFQCVVADECEDLQRGDIPRFTASPRARSIRTSSGRQIEDVLHESGLLAVRRRIEKLNEYDLAAQVWYVRASFCGFAHHRPDGRIGVPARPVDRDRLVRAALKVGERIERGAIHGGTGSTWIGASNVDERRTGIQPLGPDLYDGLPGVALFLAYLATIADEPRFAELARRALVTLRAQLAATPPNEIGALNGWGGVIYAFTHLGVLWGEPQLLAEAAGYADRAASVIEMDRVFDVVGGAAGCILALLALNAHVPSGPALGIAQRCGEHLLAHTVPCAHGVGWRAHGISEVPLTGFSHAAAGISVALLRLSATTGDHRFHTAALTGIAYERSVFSPQAQNWPDFRPWVRDANRSSRDLFQTMWCHGASGIGLARLASSQFLDGDPLVDTEIESALCTTERDGFSQGHSLCHGGLGNLELLHVAAQRGRSPALRARVLQLAAAVLDDADENGWRCGNHAAIETPGLMTGLAGMGYQLLRLAEPAQVASILSFDAPIGTARSASLGQ